MTNTIFFFPIWIHHCFCGFFCWAFVTAGSLPPTRNGIHEPNFFFSFLKRAGTLFSLTPFQFTQHIDLICSQVLKFRCRGMKCLSLPPHSSRHKRGNIIILFAIVSATTSTSINEAPLFPVYHNRTKWTWDCTSCSEGSPMSISLDCDRLGTEAPGHGNDALFSVVTQLSFSLTDIVVDRLVLNRNDSGLTLSATSVWWI